MNNLKLEKLWMQKFQYLLFVLKRHIFIIT